MMRCESLLVLLVLAAVVLPSGGLVWQAPAAGQTSSPSQPRAQSREEFEAYQKLMQAQVPDERVRLVEEFLLQYPDSQLKEYAFQAATQAYQAKNDYPRVLTYGELTLEENPENLTALLILASAIPERTGKDEPDREEKLREAEGYAQRALELLSRLPKPENLQEQEWARTRRDAESVPRAALGMIALIREDFTKAELELRRAADMALRPDPVLLYRLGLCYSFQKKYDEALEVLGRAAALGGVKIQDPGGASRDLVAEAKEFILKSRASSETAPEAAQAPLVSAPEKPLPDR